MTAKLANTCLFQVLLALFSFLAAPVSGEAATGLTQSALQHSGFDQHLGKQLPLDLPFTDDSGASIQLHDLMGNRPAILAFGYYQCPMLCNLVLNGIVESLQEIKYRAADDPAVLFIGIDPAETPALASAKKKTYLHRLGRPDSEKRWHFLTGVATNISGLAEAAGFHYTYDAPHKQYAHPAGIIVLTPDGRISKYFFGVSYAASDLRAALQEAADHRTGSPAYRLLMLCAQFMPLTGKYSNLVLTSVRALSLLAIALVAFLILRAKPRSAKLADAIPAKGGP